jgi:hypothetical protein
MGQTTGTKFKGSATALPTVPLRAAMFDAVTGSNAVNRIWFLFFQQLAAAAAAQTNSYSQDLTPAATSFTVPHELGTLNVIAAVYSAAGVLTAPLSLTVTDEDTVTVTFLAPFTGYAVVIG